MKIFISGVSSGIGRECVKILISKGHEVWGIARTLKKLENLNFELDSQSFNFSQCDVADNNQVSVVVEDMKRLNFIPDVVVLNSAIFPRDLSNGFEYDKFESVMGINLFGSMIWVDKFLPLFVKRGYGRFVAVSSTSAFRPDFQSAGLPASKSALSMAFRSFDLKYRARGINFVIVYFGPVATELVPEFTKNKGSSKYFFILSKEKAGKNLSKAILGRKNRYFFPYLITLIFRFFLIFPDNFFSIISRFLKK